MLVVHLHGGLGNQLFQVATGAYHAKKWNLPLRLNTGRFKRDSVYRRTFDVEKVFKLNADYEVVDINKYVEKFARLQCTVLNTHVYNVNLVGDLRLPVCEGKGVKKVYFDGYWQSQLFFPSKLDTKNLFEFRLDNLCDTYMASVKMLLDDASVCVVHMRNFGNKIDDIGVEYYLRAIRHCAEKFGCNRYVIVGKEISHLETLKSNFPDFYFEQQTGNICEDFFLMMNAKYFIGANSTFSWWAAYLSPCADACKVFPKKRLRGQTTEWGFDGLFCDDWTLL